MFCKDEEKYPKNLKKNLSDNNIFTRLFDFVAYNYIYLSMYLTI